MSIAVLIISDGRDDIHQEARASLAAALQFASEELVMVEVDDRDHALGFAGAIQAGWDRVLETDADYVLHFEADFTFNHGLPIEKMRRILDLHPELAQIALKRQPWNEQEAMAGGIIECYPDDFHERRHHGLTWTEHRRFFTTNPCLYPTRLCRIGWPQEPESEGKFGLLLKQDPLLRFAFYGPKYAPPMVEHIGHTRAGHSY